jgi:hypothetical protein
MTERYPMRPITPEEFDAFGEVPTEAFNDTAWPAEAIEQERLVFEFDRSLAAFDVDAIAGTAAAAVPRAHRRPNGQLRADHGGG